MCDLVAAKSAGVRSILVHRNGEECLQNDDIDLSYADQIFRNMSIAWENIINS